MSISTFNTARTDSAETSGFLGRILAAIHAKIDSFGATIAEAQSLRAELKRRYPDASC